MFVSEVVRWLVALASFFKVIGFSGGETELNWLALRFFPVVDKSLWCEFGGNGGDEKVRVQPFFSME